MFDKESLLKGIDTRTSSLRNRIQILNEQQTENPSSDRAFIITSYQCRLEELWLLKNDIEDGEYDR